MIISVDLGATNVKAALFEKTNNLIEKKGLTVSIPTRADEGRKGIEDALKCAINRLRTSETKILAVSSAGDVDSELAVITYATENLPGMTGFDYKAFGNEIGLESYAINDAQAALLGEMYFGCGKDLKNKRVVMLTLGSGVGGAYYADGRLISSPENDYARFGHIVLHEGGYPCTCGKFGCIETYLSGRAIHRLAAEAEIDGKDLFELFAKGEEKRVKFIGQFQTELATALSKVYRVSPFDVCILGGGVTDWIGQYFNKVIDGTGFNIIRAKLGNDAGVYGACVHALKARGEL